MGLLGCDPPPLQPCSAAAPSTSSANSLEHRAPTNLRRRRIPRRAPHAAIANPPAASAGGAAGRFIAVRVVVAMVSVVVLAAPLTESDAGEKLHVALAGSPEQDSVTLS